MNKKAEELNTEGCIQLVSAIVNRAKLDYMRTKPGSPARQEVEEFFTGGIFERLTGFDGQDALSRLRNTYYQKNNKRFKRKRI